MIQVTKILVPTDFSEYSEEALKYGCALAENFQAELHVLHILEVHPSSTPGFGAGLVLTPLIKESKEAAERALEQLPDENWPGEVVRATRDGHAFVQIIEYAREQQIDLIVMGTHGRSGLAQVLLGGVAEKVVQKAPCPVLTVRRSQHPFVMP